MTLSIFRGRVYAYRLTNGLNARTLWHRFSCLHPTGTGQPLDCAGLGFYRQKAASKPARNLVLSNHWQSRLLHRTLAEPGLSLDRRRSCRQPTEYGCRPRSGGGAQPQHYTERRTKTRANETPSWRNRAVSLITAIIAVAVYAPLATAQIAPYDNYSKAPSYYYDKAQAGNAEAQFLLGIAIEQLGREAEPRWGKAEDWIKKSATAGVPEAQLRLGQIHLAAGALTEAKPLLLAAAQSGIPEAQFNLGALAEEAGDGKAARRWYWQAARQGYASAQFNLALSLIKTGEEAAITDALSWLILAAENGATNAATARDQVKTALDASAIATAEKRAAARRQPQ